MPIKTLHITNAWHQSSGGISTFYRAMLEAASRHRRQLCIVVPSEKDKIEEFGEFGRIHHIRAPRSPIFDRRYRLLLPNAYLPPFHEKLTQILREERPDLVEVCDKYSVSWLAGLLRRGWLPGVGRPVLVGMNCERMDDNVGAFISSGGLGKRWADFYLGNLYIPLFDYHIANSHYTADELREAMNPRHQRPIHVLPMGVELDTFAAAHPSQSKRGELLAQLGGGPRTRLLLYAGRLSPEKNIPLLVETMERLADSDIRIIVAGSGPLAGWLERETAERVPGRVRMLGHFNGRKELAELYANCDAFLHPNPREPFGIAPLEAMAAGLPLVAPRSGGVLSYADETNAWLAESEPGSFADAVRAVFSDPAVRKDRLARARWTAQQYSWPNVAAGFFDLYDDLHNQFPFSRFARHQAFCLLCRPSLSSSSK